MRRTAVKYGLVQATMPSKLVSPKKVSPNGGRADQFLPWVTIDPISVTYMLFTMIVGEQKRITKTNTYLSKSEDGGQTWVEQQINDAPFFSYERHVHGRL